LLLGHETKTLLSAVVAIGAAIDFAGIGLVPGLAADIDCISQIATMLHTNIVAKIIE
jgi:hypothetical protein